MRSSDVYIIKIEARNGQKGGERGMRIQIALTPIPPYGKPTLPLKQCPPVRSNFSRIKPFPRAKCSPLGYKDLSPSPLGREFAGDGDASIY